MTEEELWVEDVLHYIDIANDGFVSKLNYNPDTNINYKNHTPITNIMKPHLDKIQKFVWLNEKPDQYVYNHPSITLTNDQRKQNVWRFEGIGWTKNNDGKWTGIEHKNSCTFETNTDGPNIYFNSKPTNMQTGIVQKVVFPVAYQSDSGANRNVTNRKSLLLNYKPLNSYTVSSINANDDGGIKCIGEGDMIIRTDDNRIIMIHALYTPESSGTIISPNAIVRQYKHVYSGWIVETNCEERYGTLRLLCKNGIQSDNFQLYENNDLWYHNMFHTEHNTLDDFKRNNVRVNNLSDAASFELWHQRLAHPGESVMNTIHKHVQGVPKLRGNAFWKCPSCMSSKIHKRSFKLKQSQQNKEVDTIRCTTMKSLPMYTGQHWSMDFGFMRGSAFKSTEIDNDKSITITSKDGFNSYLIIVERNTRFTWVFLTSSKHPPIEAARSVLFKFKSDHRHRTVRTDQGGELGKSLMFKDMIHNEGFQLELTGSDASAQNGLAENPNKVLAQMVRCLLYASELGPEMWSYALIHAVYIKNRIPHSILKTTPYEKFTGQVPNLSSLRIFGSRVFSRKTGRRPAKLDKHDSQGIFLGYTATEKNIKFLDEVSGIVKTATHVYYDEAHMTTMASKAPIAAQTLQRLGYGSKEHWITNERTKHEVLVQLLDNDAKIPYQSTPGSIGYDVFSNNKCDISIKPNQKVSIKTGICIQCPPGTYARVAPRSGLTTKRNLDIKAGVIDPDYRGEVIIILHNFGELEQTIQHGDKVAQLIFEQARTPTIVIAKELSPTERNDKSFGSTDKKSSNDSTNVHMILADNFELPYAIEMSTNPIDNVTSRNVQIYGDHPTLGMKLQMCQHRNLPQLLLCEHGTPAMRISKWRSELRNAYILQVAGSHVSSINCIQNVIKQCRAKHLKDIVICFATIDKIAMHPQNGTPQLYHDQLNIIGKHLWEIKHDIRTDNHDNPTISKTSKDSLQKKKKRKKKGFSRKELKLRDDWDEWLQSEWKQLNQYEDQQMFEHPSEIPKGANVLCLLWVYLIKLCGTKKSRCVCNGSQRMRGTVTLGETYAQSLEQTAARIFWAIVAILNLIAIGADASNAFAEAPPPKAPLYVRVDAQFRQWWTECKNRPPIPAGYGLRVKRALQGHPESPRLWANLIDSIIQKLGLKPCVHEPCLYYANQFDGKNMEVLILRQVDDFAVACKNKEDAETIISRINSHMSIEVKMLGLIERFNGMDISQTKWYVKLSNRTYIRKILENKQHILTSKYHTYPLPMHVDSEFAKQIEMDEPLSEHELKQVEKEFGFSYRQGIGEILYALVTCRLDVSFALIKLSQYSTKPARIHFEAVAALYNYLHATENDGIYYWRTSSRQDLPEGIFPSCKHDQIEIDTNNNPLLQYNAKQLIGMVDSDFAADRQHRKSVSGIVLRLAGGTIVGKTRFQEIIAQSSTEAEFIAAADAGKMILYVRSILEQVGMPQYEATILYEDNQGALLMAQAGKPTKKTRHVEIKHFTIQQWTELDLILLKHIRTSLNASDAMTKSVPRTLYYRHMDFIMGRKIPEYLLKEMKNMSYENTSSLSYVEEDNHTHNTHHRDSTLYQSEGG